MSLRTIRWGALVLGVLVIVFGAVVAAGVPLLLAFMSISVALAALFGLSYVLDLSVFVTNIATMLGLGIGIDYSLLMVSRFREELRSKPVEAAIEATVARAGKAILFSGLAVMVGLSGLLLFEMNALRSIGIGGMVVVALLVIGAMTLVPAILSVLGRRIDWLTLPLRKSSSGGTAWGRLAHFVMRFSVPLLILTVGLLLLLGSPFLRVRFGVPGADVLPTDAPSREGMDLLQARFVRGAMPAVVVTLTDPEGIGKPANIELIDSLSRKLAAGAHVSQVTSLTTVLGEQGLSAGQIAKLAETGFALAPPESRRALGALATKNTALVLAEAPLSRNSPELQQMVKEIRALRPQGVELHVGGEAAVLLDFVNAVYGTFPWTVLLVMGATYVTLLFLFGSLVLPLKAVLMNLLSITAAYGALVFIFQDGHLSGQLGFQPLGFVDATVPVLMFCMLFGLSMDYEVFLLSRIREAWQRTGDNVGSVAEGLQRTGGGKSPRPAVPVASDRTRTSPARYSRPRGGRWPSRSPPG